MRFGTSRVLTESPDEQFFSQKWSIFVLLQRKQLVWEPRSVVSIFWFDEYCERTENARRGAQEVGQRGINQ